jgi:hypothetical protein
MGMPEIFFEPMFCQLPHSDEILGEIKVNTFQGDQVGRIIAYLAIVHFVQLLITMKFMGYFLKKIGLGEIGGDFFTDSSGHPDTFTTEASTAHKM